MDFRYYGHKEKFLVNTKKLPLYVFDIFSTVIALFAVVSVIFTFFIRDVNIEGPSMNNTLLNGDKVVLTNFNYTPKSGDVVAINAEDKIGKIIIKRVIATEGQTLKIDYESGQVIVDGVILNEKYISSPTTKSSNFWDIPSVIPDGYVFVLGDNRSISLDSRSSEVQLISKDKIIGKAQFIIFPFNRISYIY